MRDLDPEQARDVHTLRLILAKPLATWSPEECEFVLPAIVPLAVHMAAHRGSPGDPGRETNYFSAVAAIVERVANFGGHVHPEELWREGIREDLAELTGGPA